MATFLFSDKNSKPVKLNDQNKYANNINENYNVKNPFKINLNCFKGIVEN